VQNWTLLFIDLCGLNILTGFLLFLQNYFSLHLDYKSQLMPNNLLESVLLFVKWNVERITIVISCLKMNASASLKLLQSSQMKRTFPVLLSRHTSDYFYTWPNILWMQLMQNNSLESVLLFVKWNVERITIVISCLKMIANASLK